MRKYKLINNITGWAIFLVAAIVYLLTMEPTASFWDCSEFIATAFKMEVGHPPGAPLFMMISRLFALFAFGDVTKVAMMVNAMSALCSAFTVLFLFWTITHLSRKIVARDGNSLSVAQLVLVMTSGVVGALAYTFSDTFWFSAVEGEVYAMSSFFTAIVVWMILKWEEAADQPYANRWLVLIAYMMGLSIGVHLLNLLAIPAIVFVYYFKKYPTTPKGVFLALLVSAAILITFLSIIIPGTFKLGGVFELLFVNGLHCPMHTGLVFYLLLIFGLLALGIYFTYKKGKVLLNTILLCLTVIIIGYSSFAMIIVRSNANPPINENAPSNTFSLIHYLNREQYGDRPLFFGPFYNAPVVDSKVKDSYIAKDGKYVKSYLKTIYTYDTRFESIFPRMYSPSTDHVAEYQKWANVKGKPLKINTHDGQERIERVPTFGENLKFFFRYQVGHMYLRYFMWNFAGRQDDVQSHGGILNGNWISGIKPIDALFLGNQDELPDAAKTHPSRNVYFFMPLILGLLGIILQIRRKDKQNFWVVFMLFFLTGLAIVMYLNQYPLQPRERDYSYAGSFYAFSIWIGLGVLAIYYLFRKILSDAPSAAIAALCLIVPIQMGVQNWHDHDRSGRFVARDFARNYLETCAPNAILFTNGDNDTFPLWYAQEVEGIRTDVKIINLSLLGTDWYCDQMKRWMYDSPPAPITMASDKYVQGTRDVVYVFDRIKEHVDLKQVMQFVASDQQGTRLTDNSGRPIDYLPTKLLKLPVDKNKVLANGIVAAKDSASIVPEIRWELKKEHLLKNGLMVLEIIANNSWERPIYFVSPYGDSDVGLSDYYQLDGFAYQLVPIQHKPADFLETGRVNSDLLYQNLMNKYTWGRMQEPDVFIDHNIQRTALVLRLRNQFLRLSDQLLAEGKKDSAIAVLDRVSEIMPTDKFPHDYYLMGIIDAYYRLNQTEKANALLQDYAKVAAQNLKYYASLGKRYKSMVWQDVQLNLQTLSKLIESTQQFSQPDLRQSLENDFNLYVSKFYAQ